MYQGSLRHHAAQEERTTRSDVEGVVSQLLCGRSMQEVQPVSTQQGKQWLNAAKLGESETLTALLAENSSLLHHKGSGIGHTAVHWCAAKGHLSCLQWLLQQGADINSPNAEDSTALHAAAANGQEHVVCFLLRQPSMTVDARDSCNETAQQVAESKKWLAVAALIAQSRQPEATSVQAGATQASIPSPDIGQDQHLSQGSSASNLQQQLAPNVASSQSVATASSQLSTASSNQHQNQQNQQQQQPVLSVQTDSEEGNGGMADADAAATVWALDPGVARSDGVGVGPTSSASETALVSREQGKAWLDAARYGKLHNMRSLLKASGQHKAALVAYDGAGTSYGLMGHTALHWAAAKGFTEAVAWLLQQGADANSPNQGGSTPLHSAAGHGQAAAAEMLLLMGHANGLALDITNESPRSLATSLGHAGIAHQIDLAHAVNRLRGQPQSLWDMKSVREVLQLSGINMAALLERHEVMTACQQQLDKMPKPVGMAALTPSTCTLATGTSARPDTNNALPVTSTRPNTVDTNKVQLDSDEDDEDIWTQAAAAAKQRGNAMFQRAEHQHAVQLYTMGINVQTHAALSGMTSTPSNGPDPLAAMYSNRSAAYASLGRWNEALDDADACTTLAPQWSKGHCRLAAALRAKGEAGAAVAAYRRALELDPSCESAVLALQKLTL